MVNLTTVQSKVKNVEFQTAKFPEKEQWVGEQKTEATHFCVLPLLPA